MSCDSPRKFIQAMRDGLYVGKYDDLDAIFGYRHRGFESLGTNKNLPESSQTKHIEYCLDTPENYFQDHQESRCPVGSGRCPITSSEEIFDSFETAMRVWGKTLDDKKKTREDIEWGRLKSHYDSVRKASDGSNTQTIGKPEESVEAETETDKSHSDEAMEGETGERHRDAECEQEDKSQSKGFLRKCWDWVCSDEPGETFPFGISLFLLLICTLFDAWLIGMDFRVVEWLPENVAAKRNLNLILPLLFYLLISMVTTSMFYFLRSREWIRNMDTVLPRTVWKVWPPLVLAYVALFLTGNTGGAVFHLVVLSIFGGFFTVVVAFRDVDFSISEAERQTLFIFALTVCVILTVLSIAYTVTAYVKPDLMLDFCDAVIDASSSASPNDCISVYEEVPNDKKRTGLLFLHSATIVCLMGVATYGIRTIFTFKPANSPS